MSIHTVAYYSAMKRDEACARATAWPDLGNSTLSERRASIGRSRLQEMSRVDKSMQTGNRFLVDQGQGQGVGGAGQGQWLRGAGFPFGGDKKVLKLVAMAAQLCEYSTGTESYPRTGELQGTGIFMYFLPSTLPGAIHSRLRKSASFLFLFLFLVIGFSNLAEL